MLWDHPQHQPASPKRNLRLVSISVNGTRMPYFSYTLCDRCNTFAFGLGSPIRWILQLGPKRVNVSAVLYFSYTLCDRCNEFAFGFGSAIRISRISWNSEVWKSRNQRIPMQKCKKLRHSSNGIKPIPWKASMLTEFHENHRIPNFQKILKFG